MTREPKDEPKALIVGAKGQVGAAICSVLDGSALPTGREAKAEGELSVGLAELAAHPGRAAEILGVLDLAAVYCVGGATDVERCESDPQWARETNCLGPAALAAASRSLPFVYFSTDYIFDGSNGPYTETDVPHALSVYGRSKLEGEQRVLDAHPDALILRTTVVFGPDRQRKNFLYTLRRLLSTGQAMRVPIDQISTPTYNEDLAHAAVELVSLGATGIYNAAGPDVSSRYDFAIQAASILGLDTSLLTGVTTPELQQKAPRPLRAGLRTDKLRSALRSTKMRGTADAIAAWAASEPADVPLPA